MSNQESTSPGTLHRLRPLVPRDPNEKGRSSSPLELLFDLTFAAAFSVAGTQFAELLAKGELRPALLGMTFACFCIIWAWINYSWFASAYDNDDWGSRLQAMIVMVGVVIFALGIPPMFKSVEEGDHLNNRTIVLGYVVMRLALLVGWLRARRNDPERRSQINAYLTNLVIAQAGWIVVALVPFSLPVGLGISVVLVVLELIGPVFAERGRVGTPWHPEHITERYGLLAIVTLGEGVIGTVASLSAVVGNDNWSFEAVLVVIAGIGLTFAMWWVYYAANSATILEYYRERVLSFAYLHFPVFISIAAVGAGLHVSSYWITREATISEFQVVGAVAIPVLLFVLSVNAFYYAVYRGAHGGHQGFHGMLVIVTCAVIAVAMLMASRGVSIGWCLIVVMLAPWVSVVGYETVGHRHIARDEATLLAAKKQG